MPTQPPYTAVVENDDDDDDDLAALDYEDTSNPFHDSGFSRSESHRTTKSVPETLTGGSITSQPAVVNNNSETGPFRGHLWTLGYYTQFFDVDTNEVLKRCWAALYPRTNFLMVLDGNPDLYGPVWIATTVVLILFLAGSISRYISLSREGATVQYDFTLLSGAAGLIYGYTGIVPIALWAVLRWFGSESANLMECWSLYGYANLIWIPVAIISWSRLSILNYIFVGIGFAWSTTFIIRNLYPVLTATDRRTSRILLVVVTLLHAGLAIAIKMLFFANESLFKKD